MLGVEEIMKVLYINTYFYGGGAELVVRQLYYSMKSEDIETYCVVGRIQKDLPKEVESIYSGFFDRAYTTIVGGFLNNTLLRTKAARRKIIDYIIKEKIDIVHFHNIHSNYFGLEDILEIQKYCKNIVITLHDMWLLTGGCAYSCECMKWEKSECKECKGNYSMAPFKYSSMVYKKKKYNYQGRGISYITPSKWLQNQCIQGYMKEESVKVINNGLDMFSYKAHNKGEMRELFHFPQNKNLLLFVANGIRNPFKGFPYLLEALKLIKNKDKYALVIVGNKEEDPIHLDYELFTMGYISSSEKMNQLYSAADLFIHPSVADVYPFTPMESLASGTPVLAFKTGGIPEIVTEEVGWLVESRNSTQLAQRIEEIFDNKELLKQKTKASRIDAEKRFDIKNMISGYRNLYKELLKEG